MSEKAVRMVIEGRVQGVWFRGWAAGEAARLHIRGWIRNRRDGTVEAIFAGAAADVDAIIKACRQGPPAARVETLIQHPAEAPEGMGFRSLPTA